MSSELGHSSDGDDGLGFQMPAFDWRSYAKNCRKCGEKSVYGRYVNCDKCRSINKAKEDARKDRKLRFQQAMARFEAQDEKSGNENATLTRPTMPLPSSDDVFGGGERKALSGAGANIPKQPKATTATTKKVKAKSKGPVALRDLEGKEKELAMSMMKQYVKREARSRGITSSPQAATDPKLGREYQTATALYGGIRSKYNASRKIQFRGFHTIVPTPEIDHKKRLDMVIVDIRKIARVPFDHHAAVTRQRMKDGSMYNATFQCRCSSFDPMFQPKGSYEVLQWQRQRRMAETKGERGECNGIIKLVVERDAQSHPFGIEGQRVSVAIEHPGPEARPV